MVEYCVPRAWTDHVVTVADGGSFRVTRAVSSQVGMPVVLVPGMFDNRRLYLWPCGNGLAETLAAAGFDVWIVERRGTGGVPLAAGVRAGWQEVVRVDLPAVQQMVATQNGRPAFWIAHSFGGVAVARAAALNLARSQIAGLVLINAAVWIPLLANPLVTTTLLARSWGPVFPSRRFRLGPEDEPVAALADAVAWGAGERAVREFSNDLSGLDVPLLALTAPLDVIAPAARCAELAAAFSSGDGRIELAARRRGFARNHTHESPLLHPVSGTDVFPFVRDWLVMRTGEDRPILVDTADWVGRHRLHYTVELDVAVDRVWQVISHRWSTLWPVRQRRIRDGVDWADPDGLRSVRAQRVLGIWPIQEEIVTYRAPRLIEYRTTRGPIHNHLGRIELTDVADGRTRLDYRITFDASLWLLGRLLVAALGATWRFWGVPRLRREARRALKSGSEAVVVEVETPTAPIRFDRRSRA